MAIKFNQTVKHERLEFFPGIALAFEDPDAEPYFINAGWAANSSAEPVRTYTQDEVSIDPSTVHGDGPLKGKLVTTGEDPAPAEGVEDNG